MDEASLLAEIAANPDDDAPRLVYADWLTERGDPRGELIALQIKQWRHRGYDPQLTARVDELLRAHGAAWKAAAGITGALTNLFRGFPESLIGTAADIVASREALRTQPITSLSILSRHDGLAELMQFPELARIRELHVSGEMVSHGADPLAAPVIELLARSPYLTGVRTLQFDAPALDDDGARVLATAAWLPAVEKLVLTRNPIQAAGVAALAPVLRDLTWLALWGCHVGEAGAAALAASPMRALAFAYLPDAGLGHAGAAALAGSPVLASVTQLDLTGNFIGDDGAIALAGSPHAGRIYDLRLAGNYIAAAGAAALAHSTALAAVTKLDLQRNRIGHTGVAAFVARTGLPALRHLGITDNEIGTGTFEESQDQDGYRIQSEVQETKAQLAARFAAWPDLVIE